MSLYFLFESENIVFKVFEGVLAGVNKIIIQYS